ncbi:arylsulfatase [Labilibaculum filiforme]|uniref:arylsulfatase n=1 Tax=Labilibaculum filiforme TaxID=1940526 RepID=UPI000C6CA178|nr:arylsulfatase [Labilibaculum filiforme]
MRINQVITSFFVLIIGFSSCQNQKKKAQKLPNILLIVADDQAYGDLSLTENPYLETPVLDGLAKEGVFANHFYVSPVCAPTRASLLTGRYHQKTGVSGVTRGREDMRLDETTMATILKSFDYTTGIFGKWHNGAHYPYHPLGRGFDEFVGFTSGHWSNYFDTTIEKNGKDFQTKGYLPDVLTDEAIRFISESKEEGKPFFCYLPYQTPHTPLQVPDKYFNKYKEKGLDDFNACIYGMCENLDDNVGRLLKQLEEQDLKENTIIVFLSDNGPLNFRFNKGLKGRKGMEDEGGVRVPFIISWKGKTIVGKTISTPLAHIDLLPTLLDLIGKQYEFEKPLDGLSFASLLKEEAQLEKRKLYGEWSGRKRVLSDPYLMIDEELFDIQKDPEQLKDIRSQHAELFDSLQADYKKWYDDLQVGKQESKAIPVGYKEYPICKLPAHEANLFPPFEFRKDRRQTGIAYHSLYGWAHDWIDFWTKTDAYAQWQIDVVEEANYKLEIYYALADEDVGTKLKITIGDEHVVFKVDKAFIHSELKDYDRVKREQEAPETDWGKLDVGNVNLKEGKYNLTIQALDISGKKTIELKEIHLIKN